MQQPGSLPLFHDAFRRIASRIESGELSPGDRLPSERWLEEDLGVSRTTVRRALRELLARGVVELKGGAIYVAEADEAAGNRLTSLTELARARGLRASALVLSSAVRPATLDEADAFQIAPGAELFELRRLRLLDEVPVAVDHNRLPLRLLPRAPEIDFRVASLYASLEQAGNALLRGDFQIEARAASDEEAAQLALTPASPVLVSTERVAGRDRRSVTIGCTVYRSDRHRFLLTFTRTPPPPPAGAPRGA